MPSLIRTHHWSNECCTRCGASGGRNELETATAGWIEDEDREVRLCPECCTTDEYRLAAQPFLDAMDCAKEWETTLPDWLFDEVRRIGQYIVQQEREDADLSRLGGVAGAP